MNRHVDAFLSRAAEQLIPADPRQLASHAGCRVPCCLRGIVARAAEFGRSVVARLPVRLN